MDRMPQGCDRARSRTRCPYVRGLYRLIPEHRLAAILSRTGRVLGTPAASAGRVRRLAGHRHGPLRRRLDPQGLAPAPPDPRRARARPTPPSPRPDAGSASRRCGGCSSRPPAPWPPTRPSGASYRGWRLMGLDGTTLDLPDTPDNARTFGRPTTGRAEGAFPQVRLLALCELGTHAVCGLAIKPLCHGEPSMVGQLLDHLGPGMLLIWDRGFFSYELISAVVRRGAHLLARVKSNTVLRPIRRLADGSYLAKIYPSEADRRRDMRGPPGPGHRVHPRRPEPPRCRRAASADHRPDQPGGPAGARGAAGLPRAVGGRTRLRRDQDPPQRPGGADPEQDAGGGGAGDLRPDAGPLRGAAGDARRGGGGQPGPGPALVHRLAAGPAMPAARVAARRRPRRGIGGSCARCGVRSSGRAGIGGIRGSSSERCPTG